MTTVDNLMVGAGFCAEAVNPVEEMEIAVSSTARKLRYKSKIL